jgi:hypothetical protein
MNPLQKEICMNCVNVRYDFVFKKYLCIAHNNSFLNSKYHIKDYFTSHGICLDYDLNDCLYQQRTKQIIGA